MHKKTLPRVMGQSRVYSAVPPNTDATYHHMSSLLRENPSKPTFLRVKHPYGFQFATQEGCSCQMLSCTGLPPYPARCDVCIRPTVSVKVFGIELLFTMNNLNDTEENVKCFCEKN